MEKTVIRTEAAPAPFQGAPYNQAIRVGELVFVAGQLGLKVGDTAVEGDIAVQTEQVMRNLAAILEAAGSSLENLVKTSVFLQSLGDLLRIGKRFFEGKRARRDFRVKAVAFDELHDEEMAGRRGRRRNGDFFEGVDGGDPGMAQRGEEPRLSLEPQLSLFII